MMVHDYLRVIVIKKFLFIQFLNHIIWEQNNINIYKY